MTSPDTDRPLQPQAKPSLAGLDFDEPLLDFTGTATPKPLEDVLSEVPAVIASPGDDEMVLAQVFLETPDAEKT